MYLFQVIEPIKESDSLWVYIMPPAILLLALLGIYFIAIGLKRNRNDRLQRIEDKLDTLQDIMIVRNQKVEDGSNTSLL